MIVTPQTCYLSADRTMLSYVESADEDAIFYVARPIDDATLTVPAEQAWTINAIANVEDEDDLALFAEPIALDVPTVVEAAIRSFYVADHGGALATPGPDFAALARIVLAHELLICEAVDINQEWLRDMEAGISGVHSAAALADIRAFLQIPPA